MALVATNEKNLECLDMLANSRVAVIVHSLNATACLSRRRRRQMRKAASFGSLVGKEQLPLVTRLVFGEGRNAL